MSRRGNDWASCSILATSCFCQSVRGNPDSNVARIPCLATSEQGGESGYLGHIRDLGSWGCQHPTQIGSVLLGGCGAGGSSRGIW